MLLRKYAPYTTYLLENLINKKIACVSPSRFNDPLDSYFLGNTNIIKELDYINPENIRVSCLNFVDKKDDIVIKNEMLMWAHYGDSHKGLCIEYDINLDDFDNLLYTQNKLEKSIFFNEIAYVDNFLNELQHIRFFRDKKNETIYTLFCTKDNAFQYEKEYRIIKYSSHNSWNDIDFIDSPTINKIIFGLRCEANIKKVICNINKQLYNDTIKLYFVNSDFNEVKFYE